MLTEIWKDVIGYLGIYQASNLGRVKNIKTNKLRVPSVSKIKQKHRIYLKNHISLFNNGKCKQYILSNLIWITFNGSIPYKMQIDHIDNDPSNNRLDNLQLLTSSDNNKKVYIDNPKLKYERATKIICLNNNKIYNSQRDASRDLNIDYRAINQVLRGKALSAHGYRFEYIDDINK